MELSILSLLPPALTLILVFWTRNIKTSLIAGIVTAALMATKLAPIKALKLITTHFLKITELPNFLSWKTFLASERLFLFLFLLMLGMVMALMEHSGDAFAYAEFLRKKLQDKKSAQNATLLFSLSLFIDDYLNAITTSSVMPFLTDVFKIPRIKIAFLVTTLAAPLCTLIPISAWGPPITMFIANGGVHPTSATTYVAAEAFYVFIKSIPFIFQSILTILCGWFVVKMGISYGTIGKYEHIAEKTGNLYGGHKEHVFAPSTHHPNSHSLFNFLSPLILLIALIVIVTLYSGGYWFFGGNNGLIEALAKANMYVALILSTAITLIYSTILYFIKGRSTIKQLFKTYWTGIKEMGQSVIVLVLALSFTEFLTKDLYTGKYIAHTLMPVINIEFLPMATFLLSALIAFSMGSSWATMTLMFPIVIPMLTELVGFATPTPVAMLPLLYPLVGSVIAGTTAGSSMSPIADLLIITSSNSNVNHFDFIKAQSQYLGPLAVGSTLGFLVAGLTSAMGYKTSLFLSFTTALTVSFALLILFSALSKKIPSRY